MLIEQILSSLSSLVSVHETDLLLSAVTAARSTTIHQIHTEYNHKLPGCGLGISAQLTNKNTTILQIMVDMESTENSIDSHYQLGPIQINLQAIRR